MVNERSPPRHYCDHPNCGKSFRRAEHLNRHRLNHTNSTIPCPQCARLFYRRDLLHRHLMLKHGISTRGSHGAGHQPVSPSEGPSPDQPESVHDPVNSVPANGEPDQFPLTAIAPDDPGNGTALDDVLLPMSNNLFPFPSPNMDFTQDWSWIQQNALPILPVVSDPIVHMGNGNGMNDTIPDFPYIDNDWMSPRSFHDLPISQDIYDFLMSLRSIVEASHPFSVQDTGSILNAAFLFILESLPIFHQPSFNFDLIRRELCASIFCVGLLIARDPELYRTGCALLGQIRAELLQYINTNTIYLTDLGILQAMLIIEFSGMYLADRTAMELSDIFHGTLLTLARRLGLFEMTSSAAHTIPRPSNHNEWQSSDEFESAKRLAYFVFALDVEHALLFGHERSIISIYSIQLELPSEEGDWQLPYHHGTSRQNSTATRTKFHALCHHLLTDTENQTATLPSLTQFSHLIILLGLASIVLDLLRRQRDPFFDTKQALSRLGVALPAIHSRLMAGPEGPMKIHGRAVYHITAISLSTRLEDLERAANDGFSRTGRTPKHHTRAAMIRLLTKGKVGAEPARHAVHLLKLYLIPALDSEPPPEQGANYLIDPNASPAANWSRYEPSALYFGVLTLWAFVIGRVNDDDDHGSTPNDLQQAATSASTTQTSLSILLQDLEVAINRDDGMACRSYLQVVMQHAMARLALRRNNNAQEYSQVLRSLTDSISI